MLHRALAQVECQTSPSLAFQEIPEDVCPNAQSEQLKYFDLLAWQTFKMLVWPASATGRGNADEHQPLTGTGSLAFETYKADWETFLPKAATPTAWDDYSNQFNQCRNKPPPATEPGDLILASRSEFGNIIEGDPTGLTNVLVAQNRTYVRYLAAYNRRMFEKIVTNRLFDPATLDKLPPPGPGSTWPVPALTIAPAGAMTVKSAWVELAANPGSPKLGVDPGRIYTRDAWLQDPATGVCHKAKVGLVGLHFVHKTPSRPQWIWATFEHVDNVPDRTDPPGKAYVFNSGNGDSMPAQPPPGYRIPGPSQPSSNPPEPINVDRLQLIEPDTESINRDWQEALHAAGSVWQYYRLVMTQWPLLYNDPERDGFAAVPVPPCGLAQNTATANTVLETFFQEPSKCARDSRKTCVGCHNAARTTDFVWSIPLNEQSSSIIHHGPSPRIEALRTLRDIVQTDAQ